MPYTFRYVAPAGSPMTLADMANWIGAVVSTRESVETVKATLRDRLRVDYVGLTSTGRAGMTLLLNAMRRIGDSRRTEVVIPSYTCYSVAASIVKAGLRPRVVDISTSTLDYDARDLARTDFSRVLAVVATNLYGYPNDLPTLVTLARTHGVFVLDDAAQSLGATYQGRPCGTFGDAGLFSFDKGKNVAAIDGGVVVSNSPELSVAIDQELAALVPAGRAASAIHVVKALAYCMLLRPWLYGLPARMPMLGLGTTIYTTDYPLGKPDRALTALAAVMLRHLDEFTARRRENAQAILDTLRDLNVGVITALDDAAPAFVRLPVLMPSATAQQAAITALTAAGIGATGSYPGSIADIPELRPLMADATASGGRDVARRIVTLPTHPYVTSSDIQRIRTVLGHLVEPRHVVTAARAVRTI